jgi:hypothetical protein
MSVRIQEGSLNLDRVVAVLSSIPGAIPRATYAALKRAGEAAKTQAGRLAAAEYFISQGSFSSNSKQTTQTSAAGMTIRYAGRVLPLLTFNTRYTRGGGLMFAQVRKDSGGGTLRHVFTANIGGRLGAYERKGPSRFPVEGKYGPSTAHMMQHEKVIEGMVETMEETFDRRIEHEITRILSGYGR